MFGQTPSPGAQPAQAQPMGRQWTPQMMSPQDMGPMGFQKMMGGPMPPTMARAPRAEETYVENILRMNRGKVATIYTTNENNPEWGAKVFKGRVENAARDHVVLSDPQTGMRYIILMVNIDYITFDEPLVYEPHIYGQPGRQ